MLDTFDIVIVGGGLVGASMACALDGHGWRVAMVEAFPLRAAAPPTFDDRTLALSLASCRIFANLGLWPHLRDGERDGVTPIKQVQVSSLGQFGQTRIRAEELGVPYLGNVVEARLIGEAVRERLPTCRDLTLFSPATLKTIVWQQRAAKLTIDCDGESTTIKTKLVIGADGTDSLVRELAELDTHQHDYQQTAIIANVSPGKPHGNIAFERLTPTGPLALLPHVGDRCGMVWVTDNNQVEELLMLESAAFIERLQQRFGLRLGRFHKLGERTAYPLRLVYAAHQYRPRAVIIGNAAHTIHNVAAQGFNLGLRDVATLADVLTRADRDGLDLADEALLAEYQALREPDQRNIIDFTDGLIRGFAQDFGPVRMARSAGLAAMDAIPGLKQILARRAMGFGGEVPALARETQT